MPGMSGMRARREDGSASTVHGCRSARIGALASILALTAVVVAGCASRDATGSAGSTEIVGGVGLSGPDDGAAPLPEVSIDSGTTADGGTTDEGGTTDDAAAAVGSGEGHAICAQSWSGLTDDQDSFWAPTSGARMVAVDGVGNLYVAAPFLGTVNVGGQTLQSAGIGVVSLLVVKLDPACRVLWTKVFGAPKADIQLAGVAADAAGNVVVAGDLSGAPVDFGTGSVDPGTTGESAVIFKLGPNGQGLWTHLYTAPLSPLPTSP